MTFILLDKLKLREYDTVARADNYFAEYRILFLRRHSNERDIFRGSCIDVKNPLAIPTVSYSLNNLDCSFIPYMGPSWPWSYGIWIYNYLCNQCLSPLMLWVRISIRARCTTLCDKVGQWLATGRWFSPDPPVSSTNKTDRHDIAEILLKVAINTIKQTNKWRINNLDCSFILTCACVSFVGLQTLAKYSIIPSMSRFVCLFDGS